MRKPAAWLDGVDVSSYVVGDVLTLDRHEAEVLVAEGWAAPVPRTRPSERRYRYVVHALATAADTTAQTPRPQRRAEDRLREALHDARGHVVKPDGS